MALPSQVVLYLRPRIASRVRRH